jgi:hypothetical protein
VEAIHHLTLHLTLDGFDTEAEQIRRIVAALASEKDIAQAVRPMIHNLSTMPLTEDTRQALTDTMTEALRLNPGGAGNRVNLDKNPLA